LKGFNHVDVKTISEAVQLLKDNPGKAKLIAGGTDLLGILKNNVLPEYPEVIINIKSIPGLDYIREDNEGLKIGALVKLEDVARSPLVKGRYQLLAEAAGSVATPQIRRMGTIGGNLCQDVRCWYYRYPHHVGGRITCYLKGGKSCYAAKAENQYHSIFGGLKGCFSVNASDVGVALLALGGRLKLAGIEGVRTVTAEEFFASLRNCLKPDEVVTEIQLPFLVDRCRQKFLKFRLRESVDFGIVDVAAVITMSDGVCKDIRISLGAVAPRLLRAVAAEEVLRGRPVNEETAELAAMEAVKNATPLGKNAYKVQILKTLVKRALME